MLTRRKADGSFHRPFCMGDAILAGSGHGAVHLAAPDRAGGAAFGAGNERGVRGRFNQVA
jgi:hypothetical protein